jgi:hypothetical protein
VVQCGPSDFEPVDSGLECGIGGGGPNKRKIC